MVTPEPDALADRAVSLVREWLLRADELATRVDRVTMDRLEELVTDPDGVAFVMQFVDRVVRPDSDLVAAGQLAALVRERPLPGFLGPVDRALVRAGARLGPLMPGIVMPLARRRMRAIVGHLVAPAEERHLAGHLSRQRAKGYDLNVNLLGEAVLGEREAERRFQQQLRLLRQPDVDYVSVKVSAVASQLNHWARDESVERVTRRLRELFAAAAAVAPPTFINLDMEEYRDLHLTAEAFMAVLGEDELRAVDAGIAIQAYLPDALGVLDELVGWANRRRDGGGGEIKIRLVKGANLAMERVDAALHGWEQTPFATKVESDANYKRCLDWLLTPERTAGVRIGVASHNLFDIAWAHLVAEERGVGHRVQFEMLQGMAPAQAAAVQRSTAGAGGRSSMLLYTPAVRSEDFDVAIAYLFRRLEENAAEENFLRHLFDLTPGSPEFLDQETAFRSSLAIRHDVPVGPRRTQNRSDPPTPAYRIGQPFVNEPDTDPVLPANRPWIEQIAAVEALPVVAPVIADPTEVTRVVETARSAARRWAVADRTERRRLLHAVGDELARRRGELITTMLREANKTFPEADSEVSEAIDFARWYADRSVGLGEVSGAEFTPLGVVAVVPPWNFPVAIPAGGVLAALAAGNAVLFKPAPETPRCAEVVAEACWAAGIPPEVLQFVRTPDDEAGRTLVTSADAVILTGSADTAELFTSWRPDLRLFAETSGKNALIITPNADVDLAVADLVRSAFGHSGQKCSAASLAILVGDLYDSPRFRRQLVDAVESIDVGPAVRLGTSMGPLIGVPHDRLERGLTRLDPGERWLVEPRPLDDEGSLWSPGVRDGVEVGSWYHTTECFGPVLGLVRAADLDQAIAIQNSSDFGLTGGIHSLDPGEIDTWVDQVEVGNAYVNRHITGAIVQRQPFGGWKRSSFGPGAKAGGPNYVAQLGTWHGHDDDGTDDFAERWADHFSLEHDPTALFCEANVFRYRPLRRLLFRIGRDADPLAVDRVRRAAAVCGVPLEESSAGSESDETLAARLATTGVERMRTVGQPVGDGLRRAAVVAGVHIADAPVTGVGRVELQHYLREQAISRTLHRFGNLVGVPAR